MTMIIRLRALPLLTALGLAPLACSDDAPTDDGDETTSGDGDGDPGDGDGDPGDGDGDPGDGDGDPGDGDGDGEPANECANCAEGELCVAWADDACGEGWGYTLECVAADSPTVCAVDEQVPFCELLDGVDRWCSNWPIQSCDPLAQDCIEGEKCVPYSSAGMGLDDHKCVPIIGEQGEGEPCVYAGPLEATDDCDGATLCVPAPDTPDAGICQRSCGPGLDCVEPLVCVPWYEAGEAPEGFEGLGACADG